MDGDQTAKTFEDGANSAMKDQDLTSGIYEATNPTVHPRCCMFPHEKTNISVSLLRVRRLQGLGPACFQKMVQSGLSSMVCRTCLPSLLIFRRLLLGSYDKFKLADAPNYLLADGAIGGTAQKIGGPLDKGGAIGKHFNADGKIGGMVQENLANKK